MLVVYCASVDPKFQGHGENNVSKSISVCFRTLLAIQTVTNCQILSNADSCIPSDLVPANLPVSAYSIPRI